MTPEAQRIAIAQACGYRGCTDNKCAYRKAQHLHDGLGRIFFPEPYSLHRYPDYLNDLNAMHEAEKVLTEEQLNKMVQLLYLIPDRFWRATAAQRAEAWLRAKGLWKEDAVEPEEQR